ncbi:nucleoside deaminase [Commensalibacter oyaizuii]|uniref:tRNA-specific adenosine deaminase n=1 Tax=Commensalibacter oyaizuii TaxID=3043873 RepID=A0ABT6Q1Y1_9PROT|nr:nucleoside deaminase [Commensalibacter sp. TBRC 16381]MDI2091115.1 nucleoside deaminase [Commensalibacter sp. TBRC 16381]
MDIALKLAQHACDTGEIPVGALVIDKHGNIIAQAINQVENQQNPTKHAEILALQQACELLGQKRLIGCTLVVTLEPCSMCAGAASHYRVDRIVFGAYDPKGGGIEHGACVFSHRQTLHKPEIIGGVQEQASQKLLKFFFQQLR